MSQKEKPHEKRVKMPQTSQPTSWAWKTMFPLTKRGGPSSGAVAAKHRPLDMCSIAVAFAPEDIVAVGRVGRGDGGDAG